MDPQGSADRTLGTTALGYLQSLQYKCLCILKFPLVALYWPKQHTDPRIDLQTSIIIRIQFCWFFCCDSTFHTVVLMRFLIFLKSVFLDSNFHCYHYCYWSSHSTIRALNVCHLHSNSFHLHYKAYTWRKWWLLGLLLSWFYEPISFILSNEDILWVSWWRVWICSNELVGQSSSKHRTFPNMKPVHLPQ